MTTAATEAAKAAVDGAKARQASWRKCAEHAAALPPAAAPLARVLTDPARAESVKAYETHSGTASSARDTHAHHTSRAAVAGSRSAPAISRRPCGGTRPGAFSPPCS